MRVSANSLFWRDNDYAERRTGATVGMESAIVARLNGGLGNQLFILAAGLAQSRRLRVPLVLDAEVFTKPREPRRFELGRFSHLFSVAHSKPYGRGCRTVSNLFSGSFLTQTVFRESDPTSYDSRINSVSSGTTLVGYFQSPKYFAGVASEIRSELLGVRPNGGEAPGPFIGVHLRRGDYVSSQSARVHGSVTADYAVAGVSLLRRLGAKERVLVFSDQPEIAAGELEARLPGAHFVPRSESPIEDMILMSGARHLVISNSTFSWWAAWLIHQRGGTVVAPRPWFANGASASELLLPEWISLGATKH